MTGYTEVEYLQERLGFLDLTVSRVGDTLKTDLFSKATDTHILSQGQAVKQHTR